MGLAVSFVSGLMLAAAPMLQAQTNRALPDGLPPTLDARLASLTASSDAEAGGPYTPRALSCSINAACASSYTTASRSVVRIIRGGESCTGVLLNNTELDGIPYVLTARHCGNPTINQTVNWTFQFGYQSPNCEDPAETPVAYSLTGATVVAAQGGIGDFALLRLSQPIPESFDVVFAGWSLSNSPPSTSVVIGHPKQDIKKITFEDDTLDDALDSWVATFDRGTIESGSSGAPLFKGSKVIGHVRSAISVDYEACSGPGGDDNAPTILMPKLSFIWNDGPVGARLSDFLDPNGSGLQSLQAIEGTSVLPVELTRFEALADGPDVLLRWETDSETNNAGFEIHAKAGDPDSEDTPWAVMGFVEGKGTTAMPQSYFYRVEDLEPGRHIFRLKQIDYDGTFEYHPEVEALVEVPTTHFLSGAYPNPFNPQTQFRLSVGQRQVVRVAVYNGLGQVVARLYEGAMEADVTRTFTIDGANLPSGLYLVRVAGDAFVETRMVTLLK